MLPWQYAVLWVVWVAMLTPAKADLPYWPPQPEPKPCVEYWDSERQRIRAATHPDVVAYLASKTEVIVRLKQGFGLMISPSARGCAVVRLLDPMTVEALFQGRQGDA